jgi:hypothetical protein
MMILFNPSVFSQTTPQIPAVDRIRLAEAFRLKEKFAEKVWKGWGKSPLAVLLVTDDNEFLIRHPAPSRDFIEIGYDKLLKSKVYWRKRVFNKSFLATFPAIDGSRVSTIVVGEAENTWVKTSTPWVVTLLHEHFHQFQDAQPGIYQDILKLDLAGGDTSGMWMLNYPFPYAGKELNTAFGNLAKQLALTLETIDVKAFQTEFAEYLQMRRDFNASLAGKDYKYLSFELWKEGTARYIEYKIADLAAGNYKAGKGFRDLKDFKTYREVSDNLRKRIIESLKTISLEELQREVVYPFGAAEALLLDRAKKEWKARYFDEKFYLDKYFE